MPNWTVAGVLEALERRAPSSRAAAWDPVGLQLGDRSAPVERVGLCHEVTEPVVAAAERARLDLLVSYHPLLFHPTTRWLAGPTPEGRALRLARAGIALVVLHTSFDATEGGAADALGEALGLDALEPFAPVTPAEGRKLVTFVPADAADAVLDALAAAGAARIGLYTHCSFRSEGQGTFFAREGTDPATGRVGRLNREPELRLEVVLPAAREAAVIGALVSAHPYEEPAYDIYARRAESGLVGRIGRTQPGTTLEDLAQQVREALGDPPLRVCGERSRLLERVAVIPGAGADFLGLAAELGADCVVTGDVRHHEARRAQDAGLAVIDAGHIPTERPGLERLLVSLAALGTELTSLLELDPDPWRD